MIRTTIVLTFALVLAADAGIIKDFFKKVTGNHNQTEETVKESSPICGSSIFSTPEENTLSPEIVLITNRPARREFASNSNGRRKYEREREERRGQHEVDEVADEFRFHVENVTIEELERHGFNPRAPVTFLIHGFTSGYPLQGWISSIVQAYTINRQSTNSASSNSFWNERGNYNSQQQLGHNLMIVNWHYAARGPILYPRAVANIPIVASYMTRFINDKLIGEAGVNPRQIELIGHSLGAHLSGFVGKNTRSKLGRIYGLDPAGPCFGAISGPLYPSSKRLAPTDAEEVITIHTNSALLGIDKPLGRYSIFVEGGVKQPGCNDGGVLKSLQSFTMEGADELSCSHSRAPNLFTYRLGRQDESRECQLIAYECKDWDSFKQGYCGKCRRGSSAELRQPASTGSAGSRSPESVECKRIGLDWQYSGPRRPSGSSLPTSYDNFGFQGSPTGARHTSTRRPNYEDQEETYENHNSRYNRSTTRRPYIGGPSHSSDDDDHSSTTRVPYHRSTTSAYESDGYSSSTRTWRYSTASSYQSYESYENQTPDYHRKRNDSSTHHERHTTTIRPLNKERERRAVNNNASSTVTFSDSSSNIRRREEEERTESVEPKLMFIKTSDTQPYCIFHYQVVLELNEPFEGKKPAMSLILQDSQSDSSGGSSAQNSLTYDEFGHKYQDKTYTHLLTSAKRLRKVDHATLLFRNGLERGEQILKSLQINYMSNIDPEVRRRYSSRLCRVKKQDQDGQVGGQRGEIRFYFEPCNSFQG